MTKLSLLSSIAIMALSVSSASAMEYKVLGGKATSMGGASVASSEGSMKVYNNPAMLAKQDYTVEVAIGAGLGIKDNKLGASISELDSKDFSTKLANYDPATATAADLALLTDGKNIVLGMNNASVNVAPEAFVGVNIKQFGFGVFGYGDINAQAKIDQTHNKLIIEDPNAPGTYLDIETNTASTLGAYQSSSMEYALNNGLTYVSINGLAVVEVPIGYGHQFSTNYGAISVGSSLKYMYGITYADQIGVDTQNITNNIDTHKTTSSTFGVDVGMLYEPSFLSKGRIGLVAKNVNAPAFKVWDGSEIKIDPQIRLGVAYDIFDSLEFAMDADIVENKTLVDSLKSQEVGGGLNFHPASWFSLRGGVKQNISSTSSAAPVLTAGMSFGLKWAQIDLNGQYSTQSNTVQGTSIPEEAKLNLVLVSKW